MLLVSFFLLFVSLKFPVTDIIGNKGSASGVPNLQFGDVSAWQCLIRRAVLISQIK
ncbi:Uncharacterized protein dnm_029630 [Desulfonema magnum]|uniref:Uncharacterized protein n=1 Tax=Desulfonema magnum TaxID=45655 RepID=A0A975GML9_9BACT|nr:Uncharacterized protein dnm_029630 [Desulfonema magnum]